MKDVVIVVVLLLVAGGAGFYLYRAKKRGEHCVGCPYAKQCNKNNCNTQKNKATEQNKQNKKEN